MFRIVGPIAVTTTLSNVVQKMYTTRNCLAYNKEQLFRILRYQMNA